VDWHTGERIRDKIAASKKKGMWTGGPVPIGYDLDARRLAINHAEAKAVRHMFRRYTILKSVPQLVDELAADGYRSKPRLYRGERIVGDIPFRAPDHAEEQYPAGLAQPADHVRVRISQKLRGNCPSK